MLSRQYDFTRPIRAKSFRSPRTCAKLRRLTRCQKVPAQHQNKGDQHVTRGHSCWITTDFVVLRPDRIGHTSRGATSSGYPRGFGYKGQTSGAVYDRCEFRNNRDGPTGKFYVRSSHWGDWPPLSGPGGMLV